MPLLKCPTCSHKQDTALTGICPNCRNRIHNMLDDIHRTWIDAHDCLQPGKNGHGSSGGSEQKLGVSVTALSWIEGHPILNILHSWEQLVREERGLTKVAFLKPLKLADTLRAAFQFQTVNLDWIVQQPWADDYYREIRDLHHAGLVACRQTEQRTTRILCPGELPEGGYCGQRLPLGTDMRGEIVCKRCGTQWSIAWLVKVALTTDAADVWLDGDAVAQWLGVTDRTLRNWASRGWVRRKGGTYALHDVKALVTKEAVNG